MKPVRIIIIAKEPRAGLAKTRLIPALGRQGAAQLADRMLRHTLVQAQQAALGPVELCVTPDSKTPYWQQLTVTPELHLSQQRNGTLGQRMAHAAERGLNGGSPVMLIGTDCPALDAKRLKTMAASLAEHDTCLCPTLDGGYSLLGLRKLDNALFDDIPWSTNQVADLTRQRLQKLAWSCHESELLADVDEPEDLDQLERLYPHIAGSRS